MSHSHPTLIGWKESIDLPDWGISDITAKTDTGARRSAIDVENIVELPGNRVQFEVAADRRTGQLKKTVIADIEHQTHVRSSNGQQHERYFVATRVRVGETEKKIELSLSNRKHMQCRMLLGRLALSGDFLVDCSKSFVTRPNRKPKVRKR
ncbi:ATP-dependent zinc protease [Pelagicoccus sp. NFK12]|uniref:ATP-dependent zinc protease n=1 Tax=Pelagicoccus enzymogenes TaxID=2773457 RepID=A0A927FD99_9BACT|nr:RimK/LysX family protein [Pelagicoccus enzymogenes]MBD5782261.1 ATP-dependent zinc protease [Pelagicoccus enzymogenes]MDQ8197843.1 RimK/LysX family protein [Pelagicoccus enzymogenes]